MKKVILVILMMSAWCVLFSAPRPAGWWKQGVFYQIFVRSFSDSDGDGRGDLRGIISRLDYLNDGKPETSSDLGITGIWLTPIFQCNSYHGYDIEDYYTINPDFGTMKDFEDLLKEAHKRGIAVVLDFVINHTSARNPWFVKSLSGEEPYSRFYVWTNVKPAGYAKTWTFDARRRAYYYSAFGPWMPDLNYHEPAVTTEIYKAARFWLDKGVDGFRLDAARHLIEEGPGSQEMDTPSSVKWWSDFTAWCKKVKPDCVLIGEVWSGYPAVSRYYSKGKGLDLCFEFPFSEKAVLLGGYGKANVYRASLVEKLKFEAPASYYAPFLANHDQIRIMSMVRGSFERMRMLSVLLLTAPGTPFIYYGEEIGMYQKEGTDDKLKRTPMQWKYGHPWAGFSSVRPWNGGPVTRHEPYTVDYQSLFPQSLLGLYKKLIRVRRENVEFVNGEQLQLETNAQDWIFYARDAGKSGRSLVLIRTMTNSGTYTNSLLEGRKFKNLVTDEDAVFPGGVVTLKGSGYLVLKEK